MCHHRHRSATRARKITSIAACAIATLGLAFALGGCEATDVDVYIPIRISVEHADNAPTTTVSCTLDEQGNAVSTVTNQGQEHFEQTACFDPYGIPVDSPDAPSAAQELDDRGQPTRMTITTPRGSGEVAYTYYDVRGRIETASIVYEDGGAQTMRYDRDGWPLEGSRTNTDGSVEEVSFVYEINENGAVTKMIVTGGTGDPVGFAYTYDENGCIATQTAPDGSVTTYEYELVANPSPLAMANALLRVSFSNDNL